MSAVAGKKTQRFSNSKLSSAPPVEDAQALFAVGM